MVRVTESNGITMNNNTTVQGKESNYPKIRTVGLIC